MFQRLTIPVTPFEQNCSLVWCDATHEAALIDPGGDLGKLLEAVEERGLTLKALWLTHAHIDHAGGTGTLARELSLAVQPGHTSIQNVMRGRVDAIGDDTHPGLMLVRLHIGEASVLAQLTRRAAADLGVALGQEIWVQMKSVALME